MKSTLRTTGWTAAAAAALLLAGCASSVKLDEAPVESRTPSAVDSGAATSGGTGGSNAGAATPQSQVAAVDLTKGAASAAATAGRVVYFDFDSFVVKDEFRSLIDTHARALAANKGKRMMIEGHTDERGGREYNLALGQKRAEAVSKSMVLLGVSEAQVEAVSFGKERPVSDGHDESAWSKNRRAELKDK